MTCTHCRTKIDDERIYRLVCKYGVARITCKCGERLTITMGMDGKKKVEV